MSAQTIQMAGLLLILLPTVAFGGVSILRLVHLHEVEYLQNPKRQSMWRAGHAHAGVLLVLSLAALPYFDVANLSPMWATIGRSAIPAAAIFVPAAFFFCMASPKATRPGKLINLAYVGFASLTIGCLILGIGLWRAL